MSVKIINIFKEDSFNDILELFRKATATEVILVLPRVGRIFHREDHFAAFAAEAQQGGKTVSVLTANPDTAQMARKFGFTVMASGTGRSAKAAAKPAALATAPPPADYDTPSFDDSADLGDVPLTADQTAGDEPEDTEDANPVGGMHVTDDTGKPVDDDKNGDTDTPDNEDLTVGDETAFHVDSDQEIQTATLAAVTPARVPAPAGEEMDYIDSVWRDKNAANHPQAVAGPSSLDALNRSLAGAARTATGGIMSRRITYAILCASVVVLCGVVYLMTGSAHVALTPIGKPLDTQITVQASDTYNAVDSAFAKIPGQLIEVTKTADNTVAATGSTDVASKARGNITVYNSYSSTPQTLVATTRFQSENGKVFRTLQSITVPGSTVSAGQPVPGKATVEVVADAPGSDFNIPAGSFIILAFKEKGDKEKTDKFNGKSDTAMSGGASGPSSVILKADYDKAKDAATSAVREQVATAIQSQGAGLTVLDEETATVTDVTSTANPDDAADSVTVTAKGTIKTIAFRTQDLKDLIAGNILNKDRLVVLPDALDLTYSDIAFKPDLGTLVFTVSIKGTGYMPVDTDTIAHDIVGKNSQSIKDYFSNRDGVLSATVTLSPFWVRSVPKHSKNVSIELLHEPADPSDR